jgi:BASS family bile acid:Na+ symporter
MTASLLLLIKLSVAGLILAIGMGSTPRDLLYLWQRPALLLRSLLAMYVAVPLVALLVARSLALPTPVEVAILVLAISAGAPLLPRKLIHLGNDAYVFSLVVTSSLLAIVTIPAWLTILAPLHGRSAELTAGDVAGVVVPSFLAPLALGMVVRWLVPQASERIADRLLAVVGLIFTLAALALLATNLGMLLAAGWTAIATLAGLSLAALAIGHVLGGPDPEDRTALAVCCATRHVGLAVLVAAAVPGPRTAVLVAAYIVASAVVCIPYIQWRRRAGRAMREVGTGNAREPDTKGNCEGGRP